MKKLVERYKNWMHNHPVISSILHSVLTLCINWLYRLVVAIKQRLADKNITKKLGK